MNKELRTKIYKFLSRAFLLLGFAFFIHNFSFIIPAALAAELKISSASKDVGLNQRFEAILTLDSQNKSLNAIEGDVSWSQNLELISINDSNSIVGPWVEKPEVNDAGRVSFQGIMPGGYNGVQSSAWVGVRPGEVFRLVFQSKELGKAFVKTENAKVLLNNGIGTQDNLSVSNLDIAISSKVSGQQFEEPLDKVPPENFLPETTRDQNIFNDKWFLVFKARDLGSGIDYYEVKEEYPTFYFKSLFNGGGNWISAESPYVLSDQTLKSYIRVRAFDKSGNIRLVELEPRNPLQWYENYLVWIIIILAGVFIAAIVIFYGKKRNFYRR